jgi:hypothetical protein
MMDENQRSQRQAAARTFLESLYQLEDSLQAEMIARQNSPSPPSTELPAVRFDLQALEAAAADIEEFMQQQDPQATQELEN